MAAETTLVHRSRFPPSRSTGRYSISSFLLLGHIGCFFLSARSMLSYTRPRAQPASPHLNPAPPSSSRPRIQNRPVDLLDLDRSALQEKVSYVRSKGQHSIWLAFPCRPSSWSSTPSRSKRVGELPIHDPSTGHSVCSVTLAILSMRVFHSSRESKRVGR